MDIEKYRYTRKGAGPKKFFLVDYWWPNGLRVRELRKGTSAADPIDSVAYRVRGADPAVSKIGVEEDCLEWEWDDEIGEEPISRSRARLQNVEEAVRIDELLGEREHEKDQNPVDVDGRDQVESDLHFLRSVKSKFWIWFARNDFEFPTDAPSKPSESAGHTYAKAIYKSLGLRDKDPSETPYRYFTQLYEKVESDRPRVFEMVEVDSVRRALKTTGFYPSGEDVDEWTYEQKLEEMLAQINKYVGEGDQPDW